MIRLQEFKIQKWEANATNADGRKDRWKCGKKDREKDNDRKTERKSERKTEMNPKKNITSLIQFYL